MKTYELIIEQKQPTCGGRAPTKSEIRTVSIDDPVMYVKALETSCELEILENREDYVLIRVEHNGLWVKYEFTQE